MGSIVGLDDIKAPIVAFDEFVLVSWFCVVVIPFHPPVEAHLAFVVFIDGHHDVLFVVSGDDGGQGDVRPIFIRHVEGTRE